MLESFREKSFKSRDQERLPETPGADKNILPPHHRKRGNLPGLIDVDHPALPERDEVRQIERKPLKIGYSRHSIDVFIRMFSVYAEYLRFNRLPLSPACVMRRDKPTGKKSAQKNILKSTYDHRFKSNLLLYPILFEVKSESLSMIDHTHCAP